MKYIVKAGMKARYKLTVRDINFNVLRESGWSDNHLTDHFFATLGANSTTIYFMGAMVGVGNAAPQDTDTSLDSFLAVNSSRIRSVVENQTTVSPRYTKRTVVSRFNAGFVGTSPANISEVGMIVQSGSTPPKSSSSPLGSRALVVDSGGNPAVVPVGVDEILDVTWEWYSYATEDIENFSIPFDNKGVAQTRDTVCRSIAMTDSGGAAVAIPITETQSRGELAGAPNLSGSSRRGVIESTTPYGYNQVPSSDVAFGTNGWIGYNPSTLTTSYKAGLGLSQGNFPTGVGSYVTPQLCGGQWQFVFSQQIPKTPDDLLEIEWDLVFERL